MINGLTSQIRNAMIKQRFVVFYHRVNNLQKFNDEFTANRTTIKKKALKKECNDRQIKNVLTELHYEIVRGTEDTFKAVLMGNRNEMQDALNWHQIFLSLHIQASTLQAVCLPLMYDEDDLDDYAKDQIKLAQNEYQVCLQS